MLRSVKALMLGGIMAMGLVAVNAPARADIIPKLKTGSPTLVGADYLWEYTAKLTEEQFLKPGAFFTIYDFAGFIPGTNSQPVNWAFSSANLGTTPSGLLIPDSNGIPNLTWTYTGPQTSNGPITYQFFSAKSHFGTKLVSNYGAQASLSDPGELDNGDNTMNKGHIIAPASVVPEPCSMALLGLGAAPLLRLRRRNRKG